MRARGTGLGSAPLLLIFQLQPVMRARELTGPDLHHLTSITAMGPSALMQSSGALDTWGLAYSLGCSLGHGSDCGVACLYCDIGGAHCECCFMTIFFMLLYICMHHTLVVVLGNSGTYKVEQTLIVHANLV